MENVCVNCSTEIEDGEKRVVDGSGQVSHMYPMNCIRHLRKLIDNIMENKTEVRTITDE